MSPRARERASAESSARDPIARWLDVFVPLLRLPGSEAQRIRDELEDHLRTRVDDLLILGISEAAAVQQAVAELGETARLARSFRSVRSRSRRRIAMNTALFAVAGLALAVSVAGVLPRTPSGASPQGAVVVAQPEAAAEKTLGIDLPEGTLESTLSAIAEATGARLYVHWSAIEGGSGLSRDATIAAIPAKNLHGSKIREILNSMLGLYGAQELAVRVEGDLLEVAPRGYFDRIEMVTREYDLTALIGEWPPLVMPKEAGVLRDGLREMIEPELWEDGEAAIVVHGSMMFVRAPERVQEMVAGYIERIEAATAARADRDKELRDGQLSAMADLARRQLETLLPKFEHETRELDALRLELWKSEYRRQELDEAFRSAQEPEIRASRLDELARASAHHDSMVQRRDLLMSSIEQTRRLIEQAESNLSIAPDTPDAEPSAAR